MKNEYKISFEEIIEKQVLEYKTLMSARLQAHVLPLLLIDDELGRLNNELTKTHNSNPTLNNIYFILYNKTLENKNLKLSVLSEEYCLEHGVNYEEAISFFPVIRSLYLSREWLADVRSEMTALGQDAQEDYEERELGGFTSQ